MSYERFGSDSDIYVYATESKFNGTKFVCCSCKLKDDYKDYNTKYLNAMVLHLVKHRNHGHKVPIGAIRTIKNEIKQK